MTLLSLHEHSEHLDNLLLGCLSGIAGIAGIIECICSKCIKVFFFDLIKRVSAIETAKEMPFMAYAGMVDLKKKEVKKSLDPMRSF